MSNAFTQETKFVAHETLADRGLAMVQAMGIPDPQYPEGKVRSVYFDTVRCAAFAEKADGDHLKRKIRIRWYAPSMREMHGEQLVAFIESKYRVGAARRKIRHPVTVSAQWVETTPLADPTWTEWLHRHVQAFGDGVSLDLVPVLCIAYERRRYVCPRSGTRIAFDRNIRAERINDTVLPHVTGIRIGKVVCEFKNRGLPPTEWSESLYRHGFRLRSFSKYGECMGMVAKGGSPA